MAAKSAPLARSSFPRPHRGQQHQAQIVPRPQDPEGLGQLDAIHPGHLEVEQGKVELLALLDPAQRIGGRPCLAGVHAPLAGQQRQDAPIRLVVVDHENLESLAAGGQFGRRRRQRRLPRPLMENVKVEPRPGSDSTPMRPSISSHRRREMARPNPVPP